MSDIEAIGRIPAVSLILDVLRQITGMGFIAMARVTDDRWIACAVRDEIEFGLKPGGELRVATTICSEVRAHGQAVVIEDATLDPQYQGHPTPTMYGFRSQASFPIRLSDGFVFGTLCAIDPLPHRLDTPEIIGSFKLFAELIAFHLETVRKLGHAEASLSSEQAVSELREQFIAVLGHDLRNPLAAVAAGVRLMKERPERASEIAPRVEQSIGRMAGLIDQTMDFARGRLGGGLSLRLEADAPVADTLALVIQEVRSSHPDGKIQADIALRHPVTCDPARLGQLISNLLGNALEHGAAGTPVRLEATTRSGQFKVSVTNEGPRIPTAVMDSLFKPFVRAALRSSQNGLGLGLYIVGEVARSHGGAVAVTSTDEETTFTFTMPVDAGDRD